jgi:hypothetical protein
MSRSHQQQHTEHTILTTYLLPPSSLPTILPFPKFISLHTTNADPKPSTTHALKRLYQDLQHQRSIDIDTVRLNIDRECARGPILKARLRERLRSELGAANGGRESESRRASRKRKRGAVEYGTRDQDGNRNGSGEDIYVSESEQSISGLDKHTATAHRKGKTYDSLIDPRENAIDEHLFGPTASVLPLRVRRYHTTTSLLEAMEESIQELEREIGELDEEGERVLGEMQETVGGLSDLRYGKFAGNRVRGSGGGSAAGESEGEGKGNGETVEGEVERALRDLVEVVEKKGVR